MQNESGGGIYIEEGIISGKNNRGLEISVAQQVDIKLV